MKINFHGVRGSYPVPGVDTNTFGGNTTCVSFTKEVDGLIKRLIIDCGTGAIPLGKQIVGNFLSKKEDMNIPMLFTHLHPDHTQAFPFFAPNYFRNCHLHLYGMKTLKRHIGMVLEQSMLPPTFPIEYKDLKSKRTHYELKDGDVFYITKSGDSCVGKIDDAVFKIDVMQAYAPSHPQQGALYYKITDVESGKKVACIWDIESKQGGDRAVVNFAKDCDYIIHDTQYTAEEYNSDKMIVQGFGHSTYDMAVENTQQAGIKNLICIHYNPAHSDVKLIRILVELQDKYSSCGINFIMASEGSTIDV